MFYRLTNIYDLKFINEIKQQSIFNTKYKIFLF